MRRSLAAVSAAALVELGHGHGHMTLPPSRNGGTLERAADCLYGECMWFSQPTEIPGEPTLNAEPLRTYNVEVSSGQTDYTRYFPWRAPGSAPVLGSGCGRAGGGPVRMMNGGTAKEFGLAQDMDGAELPVVNRTVWRRGETVEVAWAVNANHGGGYSYRLCKKPAGGNKDLTEECFQKTVLKAALDQHLVQFQNKTRLAFPAVRTTTGTFPAGSQWTRNPIPACMGPGGGSLAGSGLACTQQQFPVPFPGAYGFGNNDPDLPGGNQGGTFMWSVVDQLIVPADLAAGDYVLSQRWDSEQTTQVWFTCSDIRIAAA